MPVHSLRGPKGDLPSEREARVCGCMDYDCRWPTSRGHLWYKIKDDQRMNLQEKVLKMTKCSFIKDDQLYKKNFLKDQQFQRRPILWKNKVKDDQSWIFWKKFEVKVNEQ